MIPSRGFGKAKRPLAHLGRGAMFLVWGRRGPRSRVFARELGIDVKFVHSTDRRGGLVAPFKYLSQTVKTLRLLISRRPRLIFVQSPPTFAVMTVWMYGALTGAGFVVDAHSDAMLSPYWTQPGFLYRHLARRAVATIVTNEHFADVIRGWGGRSLVIPDIPTSYPTGKSFSVEGSFNIMVVNTFSSDEPLCEILAAAEGLEDVIFYVTGDTTRRVSPRILAHVPPNVRFTGFLPDDLYYALMGSSQAVMCLTTRDNTMQSGACEALSMGKPIVTSRWPLLERYFRRGTVHVENSAAGIRAGVQEMVRNHARYGAEIAQLQTEQLRTWHAAIESLVALSDRSGLEGTLRSERAEVG